MSATISAVLPTLAAQLTANIAALSAKEHTYSGKLGAAQAAYTNSDDSGSQSVGQVVGMLGKLGEQAGQMGQMAGAPAQAAQGGSGMFGSLIEQVMKAAQGGGEGGQPAAAAGAPAVGPGGAAPGAQQPPRADGSLEQRVERLEQRADEDDRANDQQPPPQREPLLRADGSSGAGPAPVAPPEAPRHAGDDDIGRRL
jgi:hypothetical protein